MYFDKSLQFQISLISNISIVNSPQKKKKFFCCLKKIFNGSLQAAFFRRVGKKAEKCNFEAYDTGIFTFKNEILLILLHFVEFL